MEQNRLVPLAVPLIRPAPELVQSPPVVDSTPGVVTFPRWQSACDRVSTALLNGETRVVVSGPPGTGKSLLLEQVSGVLHAAGWMVMLRQADAGPPPSLQGKVALLIDEADRLSRTSLQELLAAAPCPIVLAGLDILQSRVVGAMQVVLSPLGPEETQDYIARWLSMTGRSPDALDAGAIRRTVEMSDGVPRLAATLLGAAAWLAESAHEGVITAEHVEEAAVLRSGFVPGEPERPPEPDAEPEPAPPRGRTKLLAGLAASVLMIAAGAYVAMQYIGPETEGTVIAMRDAASRLPAALSGAQPSPTPAPAPASANAPQDATPAPLPERVAAAPPDVDPTPPHAAPDSQVLAATPEPAAVAAPASAPASVEPASVEPASVEPASKTEPSPAPATEPAAPPPSPEPPPPQEHAAAPIMPEPSEIVLDAPALLPRQETEPAPPAVRLAFPEPALRASPTPRTTAPEPAPAAPPNTPAAGPAPPNKAAPDLVSMLLKRGHDMMSLGDVSAARLLFGRAAESGSADAMLELGRTYDPAFLARSSPLSAGEPGEAARWYRRAAELGNKAAEESLRRIEP